MRFVFDCTGYEDSTETVDQNINGIAGCALMMAVRDGMLRQGYQCGPVGDEDWGWYFRAEKDRRRYICGGALEQDATNPRDEAQEASVFIQPERGLAERLRGQNRPDPRDPACADLRTVLDGLPQVQAICAL